MQQSERPWTIEAVQQLIDLAREGVPVTLIGARLHRDPRDARTSRTGSRQPVGAPFSVGSDEIDRCVLAMQTGSLPNTFDSYESSWRFAAVV